MDWDLTPYFAEFDGPAYRSFVATLNTNTRDLLGRAQALSVCDADTHARWVALLLAVERLTADWNHLRSYLGALAAVDATHDLVRKHEGRLSQDGAAMQKLEVELLRGLGQTSTAAFDALRHDPALEGAAPYLERLRFRARHSMSGELEGLAADLAVVGIEAWGRLYDNVAAKMTFEMQWPDGRVERLPMSQRRSLMGDRDRTVRAAAFRGGNESWAAHEDVLAAALNQIAGTRHCLYRRRGIGDVLDVALFDAAISRRTLDAMMEAISDGAEVARRYLRLKAAQEGRSTVAWFDLEAPLAADATGAVRWTWDEGVARLRAAFGRAYPELEAFFQRAVTSRWIDHTPRPGKQSGAFCTSSSTLEESRIFMTYQGSYADLSTLAHETGHAFHNATMRGLRPFQRDYPMTLAESASTFAELILADGLLADPSIDHAARASLLSESLNDGVAFLLDIPVRYAFEREFYKRREAGELSAAELCELMAETQRRIFGEVLDVGGTDPYFWASKLHFYITSLSFYNFPYSFGYLLSRRLYADFKAEGPAFLPRYASFLRQTGSGWAHDIARRSLGWDLEQPDFWRQAIASLEPTLRDLEHLQRALSEPG